MSFEYAWLPRMGETRRLAQAPLRLLRRMRRLAARDQHLRCACGARATQLRETATRTVAVCPSCATR
jgi:hypothetical protein